MGAGASPPRRVRAGVEGAPDGPVRKRVVHPEVQGRRTDRGTYRAALAVRA
jgi:hypothetical protein